MKEDLHIHTTYSRHAKDSIENCVLAGINAGIDVIAITDHAPFPTDKDNRLATDELNIYLHEINALKVKYKDQIKVLSGLEVDYTPETIEFSANMLENLKIDFCIGAVHFITIDNKDIKIWDIENLNDAKVITTYFEYLSGLVSTGLFDIVGHMSSILRGGIYRGQYYEKCIKLVPLLRKFNMSVEINTSILRKKFYDPIGQKFHSPPSFFPEERIISYYAENGITFTIGSDAHSINEIGSNLNLANELIASSNGKVVFFEHRQKQFLV